MLYPWLVLAWRELELHNSYQSVLRSRFKRDEHQIGTDIYPIYLAVVLPIEFSKQKPSQFGRKNEPMIVVDL